MTTYKGKFIPKNPKKYKGNIYKITYRQSWERFLMARFDNDPNVLEWSSEEVIIPYFQKLDNKQRRYFIDFYVKFINDKIVLIEVKPFKEVCQPIEPKRLTEKTKQRYLNELYTYHVNHDKWKAAVELCNKKGWVFKIVTEKTLKQHFGWKGQ